ncbi:MAG: YcxB family protein [Pontibacter sp.]|nr:YcxB family protein [Pontibacter sp.]
MAKNSLPENPSEMHLSFSTESISVTREQETTTVKWSDFRACLEEAHTIYLLQEHPYLAWSFSAEEIGAPALAELKEIAKLKLPAFKM